MMLSEISRAKTTTVQYHENIESKLVKPEEKKKKDSKMVVTRGRGWKDKLDGI